MSIGYNAQLFLSAMIFDGVLDRFKGLRIGVVELGAVWFASWVRQLDQAHRAFKRFGSARTCASAQLLRL